MVGIARISRLVGFGTVAVVGLGAFLADDAGATTRSDDTLTIRVAVRPAGSFVSDFLISIGGNETVGGSFVSDFLISIGSSE